MDIRISMGEMAMDVLVSKSKQPFQYDSTGAVLEVSPSVAVADGGTVFSVASSGIPDGSEAWCKLSMRMGSVIVKASAVKAGAVECVSVTGYGNMTVEVSTNGVDFTSSGAIVQNLPLGNVTSVYPTVVPFGGGSSITVRGTSMFSAAGQGVYCAYGASNSQESWSHTIASLMADNTPAHWTAINIARFSCMVPARGAGFRAIEIAMTKSGEMSRSGAQVEYATVGTVSSVHPSSGVITGGTMVTLQGTGFVAGRTACKFGSGSSVLASVVSSSEARCETPAAEVGMAKLFINMGETEQASHISATSVSFSYERINTINRVTPIALVLGGTTLSIEVSEIRDGTPTWCRFDDDTVVDSLSVREGIVSCSSVNGLLGNSSVEISTNGFDWTTQGSIFTKIPLSNTTMILPLVVPVTGGASVYISGSNLDVSGKNGIYCAVGGSTSGESWSYSVGSLQSANVVKCMLPARGAGFRSVEIALSQYGEMSRSGKQVEFVGRGGISSVSPSIGVQTGGTLVTLLGTGFVAGRTACKFGTGSTFLAEVLSSDEARCVTPAGLGTVDIRVVIGLGDDAALVSPLGVNFMYKVEMSVNKVEPRLTSAGGGDIVSVIVNGLTHGSPAYCLIDGRIMVTAIAVFGGKTTATAQCASVAMVTKNSTVEISTNGQDFTSNGVMMESIENANVTMVRPERVPLLGGSSIMIHGSGFSASGLQGLFCGFGASTLIETWSVSQATLISDTAITCTVPTRGSGFRALEVALSKNGVMSGSGIQVEFAEIGSVTSISPSSGIVSGGSVVTLTGTGFMTGVTGCRFGSGSSFLAIVVSSTEARCLTPAGVNGAVHVAVTQGLKNEASLTSLSYAVFAYESVPAVLEVSPLAAVKDGGSVLSVVASGIADGSQAYCRFAGKTVVSAVSVNGGIVECISFAGVAGNMTLEISGNGQDFSTTGMFVENVALANVTSLTPLVVPSNGASIIMIRGIGLTSTKESFCGFGASAAAQTWTVVQAHMSAIDTLACVAPARGSGFRALEVALSKNGEMSRSGLQVEYADIGTVTTVQPSAGSISGGSAITMSGTGFVAGRTACKFGSATAALAEVRSSTEALCLVPAGTPGTIAVKVAMGDATSDALTSANGMPFSYQSTNSVLALSTVVANVHGGSTLVLTMTGPRDGSSAWCKFSHNVFVTAPLVSDGVIECVTVAGVLGNTSVEVSTNGEDFTSEGWVYDNMNLVNVTSALPAVVPMSGGGLIVLQGLSFTTDMYCGFGASTAIETWATVKGEILPSGAMSCTVPARHSGFRAIEVSLTKDGEMSRSGAQVEYTAMSSIQEVTPSSGVMSGGSIITVTGSGFIAGATSCKFGSTQARFATIVSTTEARCVTPPGQRGNVALVMSLGSSGGVVDQPTKIFKFESDLSLISVTPRVMLVNGGSQLRLLTTGISDGSAAWCMFANKIVVSADSVSGGAIDCVNVGSAAGNSSIEASLNGFEFSTTGFIIENVALPNVTDINLSQQSTKVPVSGGSIITLRGIGFGAAMQGVYCGFGASTAAETWAMSKGTVTSSGAVTCVVPMRGAGMRAVEVALSKDGEMSRSGMQVEYASIGSVSTVQPSAGSESGGAIVTVSGEGFVAGVTACKFGSAPSALATVVSSSEIRCVAPAGAVGAVALKVSMTDETQVELVSVISKTFIYQPALVIKAVSPLVALSTGGSILSVAADRLEGGIDAWCKFGGAIGSTIVAAQSVNPGTMQCMSVAGVEGNTTIEFSTNGQDFTTFGNLLQNIPLANVTMIMPAVVPFKGGSTVILRGNNFLASSTQGVFCRFGASEATEAWSVSAGTVRSSRSESCTVPARGAGFRSLEIALSKNGDVSRSGLQVEFAAVGTVTDVNPAAGISAGGSTITVSGTGFVAGRTACKFGSGSALIATVLSSTELRCVSPAGVRGNTYVEVSMGIGSSAALVSESKKLYTYLAAPSVLQVSPPVSLQDGGSVLSVVATGVYDGSDAWCMFGSQVHVMASSVKGGVIDCVAPAWLAGNMTVEASANGQDWTSSGVMVENIAVANVTSVSPIVVPVTAGSTVYLSGTGFGASGAAGVYCGFGASQPVESWSITTGQLLASGAIACGVPVRDAGFRALEVALSKNGEMSRSGIQVEYASVGSVSMVAPSSGPTSGGSTVTLTGTGFVAGRTACKFGSSSATFATVLSSTEARCETSPHRHNPNPNLEL